MSSLISYTEAGVTHERHPQILQRRRSRPDLPERRVRVARVSARPRVLRLSRDRLRAVAPPLAPLARTAADGVVHHAGLGPRPVRAHPRALDARRAGADHEERRADVLE